jgi:hypothetical protein
LKNLLELFFGYERKEIADFRKAVPINPNVTAADVREMLIQHILTEEIFSQVFDSIRTCASLTRSTTRRRSRRRGASMSAICSGA